jgi:hypothetical protein
VILMSYNDLLGLTGRPRGLVFITTRLEGVARRVASIEALQR